MGKVSEAQKKATEKYKQKTYKRLMFNFRKVEHSDVLEKLESKGNAKTQYIVDLVRNDMKKEK